MFSEIDIVTMLTNPDIEFRLNFKYIIKPKKWGQSRLEMGTVTITKWGQRNGDSHDFRCLLSSE